MKVYAVMYRTIFYDYDLLINDHVEKIFLKKEDAIDYMKKVSHKHLITNNEIDYSNVDAHIEDGDDIEVENYLGAIADELHIYLEEYELHESSIAFEE